MDVLERAKAEVAAGHAKNLSALVSETLDERLRRNELDSILDAMDAEYGPPGKDSKAWAKGVFWASPKRSHGGRWCGILVR